MSTPTRTGQEASLQPRLKALFEEAQSNTYQELEVKFGASDESGRFCSGIQPAAFNRLFAWLDGSKCWRDVRHHEYVDYSFNNNIRGSGGLFQENLSYLTKRTHCHLDALCWPTNSSNRKQSFGQAAVRFSSKSEIPTELGVGRDVGTYASVRVKQRSSFIHKYWSFDLTKVWTGADPIAALSTSPPEDPLNFRLPLVRNRPPDTHEVEIEFLQNWWLENHSAEDGAYLAKSMLIKVSEVLNAAHLVTEPFELAIHKEVKFKLEEDNT